jgi:cupin fold WbuC family metalloprotein
VCLRGKLRVEYYDEQERKCTESFILEPNGDNVAVSIPIGMWHTVRSLESGTCILDMKNGPYEPIKEGDVLKI